MNTVKISSLREKKLHAFVLVIACISGCMNSLHKKLRRKYDCAKHVRELLRCFAQARVHFVMQDVTINLELDLNLVKNTKESYLRQEKLIGQMANIRMQLWEKQSGMTTLNPMVNGYDCKEAGNFFMQNI